MTAAPVSAPPTEPAVTPQPPADLESLRDSIAHLRLVVLSDAAPERNGVGAYYSDLVEHFRELIECAELFCPGSKHGDALEGVSFPLPGDGTQRFGLPHLRNLSRKLGALRPTIIVVPTPGPYGLFGLQYARRHRVALVSGFHTDYERLADMYWNRVFDKLGRFYLDRCNRFLFRRSDVILANSRPMLEKARVLGAASAELMGTPIPPEFVKEPVTPLRHPPRTVLYAGRLAPEKNVEAVLEAAAQNPHRQFIIAGDGPLRGQVEDHAGRLANIDYRGWLERTRMRAAMDEADLLILPSHVESFGTVALEGMARQLVVLVSERCGIADWTSLERGIFRMQSGESVAAAIERVANQDAGLLDERAAIARSAAVEFNQYSVSRWLWTLSRYARQPD